MPDRPLSTQSDWNVERFGPERPACRHDFNAIVAERDRYLAALERIAEQGLGEYDHISRRMMGATGEPWEHWATIARRAIDAG